MRDFLFATALAFIGIAFLILTVVIPVTILYVKNHSVKQSAAAMTLAVTVSVIVSIALTVFAVAASGGKSTFKEYLESLRGRPECISDREKCYAENRGKPDVYGACKSKSTSTACIENAIDECGRRIRQRYDDSIYRDFERMRQDNIRTNGDRGDIVGFCRNVLQK